MSFADSLKRLRAVADGASAVRMGFLTHPLADQLRRDLTELLHHFDRLDAAARAAAGMASPRAAHPFVRVTEDRRFLIISRCDWTYPQATEGEAGPRDEQRHALIGGRSGDIVLLFAEGAWLDADDAERIFADAFGVLAPSRAIADEVRAMHDRLQELRLSFDAGSEVRSAINAAADRVGVAASKLYGWPAGVKEVPRG